MIYASAASTPARLGIGTAGQVLTVSGGVPAWTTIAAGGVTSVTGTAPIASSGGATPAISITPGTARQLLQTNAGGTAAEFASNIDVPGTLDVTGAAVFDNTVTVAGTHLQLQAQGDLRFADSDSSNYVAFQAPATVAANVTWTLPAADGTAGAVLSTNASGVTSWNDLGNGVALNGTAIKVSIGSASAPPTVGTPAANAMTGSMYWDDVAGAMFYRYDNGGTPVWVQASAGGGGAAASDWTLNGSNLYPTTATNNVLIGGTLPGSPNIALTAAGSIQGVNAAIGNTAGVGGVTIAGDGSGNGSIQGVNPGTGPSNLVLQPSGGNVSVASGNFQASGYVGAANNIGGMDSPGAGTFRIYSTPGTNTDVISGGTGGVRLAPGATSWAAISDEREKTDLNPITEGLEKVASLRAVTGRYVIDDEGTSRSFLIAQDVQAVLPEAVSEGKDEDKTLSLRYTEVIPLLVSALQDAKAEIDSLKARLDAAGV
jgi:hypothetical protein